MALIKCPECGKEISDQADFCPNCGYSFEEKKRKKSKVTSGRDKTSTGLILHSVAAVAWVVFFTYMFLILGGDTCLCNKGYISDDACKPVYLGK